MGLADRYTAPDPRTAFEKWFDSLTGHNRDVVEGWLHNRSISPAKIAEMIREDEPDDGFVGYRANKDTIATWRRTNVSS